ncbi:MAG: hypothetical protein KC456_11950 [Flavobacteriales bacterium]|nr:hypothetical protein [Flavobacteriales bacterium]
MIRILSFALLIFGTSPVLFAQSWDLRKDEDGIKVYTKVNDGHPFDSFKAEMKINLTVPEITKFLKHMDEHPEAFPDTKEIRILERPNDSTQIQYALTDAPWPVSDRDGIYKLVFQYNKKTGQLVTKAKALPTYLPEIEDVVRIALSDTYWIATPIDEKSIKLEYIVHADPGGNIPEWLANTAAVDVPFDTFINIRKALAP